jgi:poly(A) polymerase
MITSDSLLEGAKEVARKLRDHGFESYFAGGCVRDLLLGQEPKDYDIVTDATPDQVTALFKRTFEVGAAFGVVRVLWSKGREYEVATYRTEALYTDGRRPDVVAYSKSKEEDVTRRDFTINALLMEPVSGEILDFVGGRADLAAQILRAVGDPEERFKEDKLRMLRAVRFSARLGFAIEPRTRAAVAKHAAEIGVVSVERIVMELHALFLTERPGQGWRDLVELGLAIGIFKTFGFEPPGEITAARLDRIPRELSPEARLSIAWAVILDGAELDLEELLRSLKLSREMIRSTMNLLRRAEALASPERLRLADRVRIAIDPELPVYLAYLSALDHAGAIARWHQEFEALARDPLPPLPLIGGADLKALGIPQGPRYKELLKAVETETLERRIRTKEEAIELVRSLIA